MLWSNKQEFNPPIQAPKTYGALSDVSRCIQFTAAATMSAAWLVHRIFANPIHKPMLGQVHTACHVDFIGE